MLIDSGYLNYYLQGHWVFIASITFMLVSQWVIGLRSLRGPYLRPGGLMILFLACYVTVGMIITNPLRSPGHIRRSLRFLEAHTTERPSPGSSGDPPDD